MTEAPAFDASNTPFESIGGEPAVRTLVDAFYDRMDTAPEAADIRAMHPDDLTESRDKLFKFLCGWLGGPQYYIAQYGHPRLRMRHAPFAIDESARDAWLSCMTYAMDAQSIDGALRAFLDQRFTHVADFMRNR